MEKIITFKKYTIKQGQEELAILIADTQNSLFYIDQNLEHIFANYYFCMLFIACCSLVANKNTAIVIPKLKNEIPSTQWLQERNMQSKNIYLCSPNLQLSHKKMKDLLKQTSFLKVKELKVDISLFNSDYMEDYTLAELYYQDAKNKMLFSTKGESLLLSGNEIIFQKMMKYVYMVFYDMKKEDVSTLPHVHLDMFMYNNSFDLILTCYRWE